MKDTCDITLSFSPGIGWETHTEIYPIAKAQQIVNDWMSRPTIEYNAGSVDQPSFRSTEYKFEITRWGDEYGQFLTDGTRILET